MTISEEQRTAARKAGATGSLDVTADRALQVAYLMTFLDMSYSDAVAIPQDVLELYLEMAAMRRHLTEERRVPRVMR